MKKIILFLGGTFFCYALSLGEIPSNIVLDKSNGGTSEGKVWHSSTLKGKVHTLIYMDPDKREDSKLLLDALAKLNYPERVYSTVAIINLAATWMPNAILQSKLKSKQKELKNMEYIFDKTKFLIKKWHLKDDASNVFVLNKKSKVIYAKSGKLDSKDIINILSKINESK